MLHRITHSSSPSLLLLPRLLSHQPFPSSNFKFPFSLSPKRFTLNLISMASSHSLHNHTNRLASQQSPYLLQHAHNPVSFLPSHLVSNAIASFPLLFYYNYFLISNSPFKVDWYPWGEEAFAEARRRDVPIFLSSNYLPLCILLLFLPI